MDPIRAEKLRAMKTYQKNQSFLYNLILHSLISLSCSLLFSYPYWFSSLCCTMKHFLISSCLPNISAFFVNPNCLFVLVNVIVVFLVGESKLVGSKSSSPVGDIYDEYVERSQSLRGQNSNTFQEGRKGEANSETNDGRNIIINHACLREEESNLPDKKEEKKLLEMNFIEDSSTVTWIEGTKEVKKEEEEVVKAEKEKEVNVKAEEDVKEDEDEETGLPAEELSRRADEFIARINRQMWIEAI